MAKMTLDELRALRSKAKKEMNRRDTANKQIQIIVGMGTCGIAAGAKDALNAFIDEIDQHNLHDVAIKQTGCMGLCYSEPTVEVVAPEMPDVIYGNVDGTVAKEIVRRHIMAKELVEDHIYDRPAPDIVERTEE
jgi:NADP-reducing hydrogenase subunit HndB